MEKLLCFMANGAEGWQSKVDNQKWGVQRKRDGSGTLGSTLVSAFARDGLVVSVIHLFAITLFT